MPGFRQHRDLKGCLLVVNLSNVKITLITIDGKANSLPTLIIFKG